VSECGKDARGRANGYHKAVRCRYGCLASAAKRSAQDACVIVDVSCRGRDGITG
jgi:hypothetical protein